MATGTAANGSGPPARRMVPSAWADGGTPWTRREHVSLPSAQRGAAAHVTGSLVRGLRRRARWAPLFWAVTSTGTEGHSGAPAGAEATTDIPRACTRHGCICASPAAIRLGDSGTGQPREPTWAGGGAGSEDRLPTSAWTGSPGWPLGNGGSPDRAVAPEVTTRDLGTPHSEDRAPSSPSCLPHRVNTDRGHRHGRPLGPSSRPVPVRLRL